MYELYYWPTIQGRGEFVRLLLEDVGADYVDVIRRPKEDGGGVDALRILINTTRHFAPPILRDANITISQTPIIMDYLGTKHQLTPANEDARREALRLSMLLADFLVEAHDVHHPLAKELYYEDQLDEALRRSLSFRDVRIPKFYSHLEEMISANGGYLVEGGLSHADFSLFQIVEGMRYAFPKSSARLESDRPRLVALHAEIAARPNIQAYIISDRRIPFNKNGIFRYYPELDG
ncbi:MAG TPA: glutathione S-transferase [Rhodospirillaceae bacterium]|nr:glutathione S-transferase [Rhodospirillaceae bacterium]